MEWYNCSMWKKRNDIATQTALKIDRETSWIDALSFVYLSNWSDDCLCTIWDSVALWGIEIQLLASAALSCNLRRNGCCTQVWRSNDCKPRASSFSDFLHVRKLRQCWPCPLDCQSRHWIKCLPHHFAQPPCVWPHLTIYPFLTTL
jgi:hypothetical protein